MAIKDLVTGGFGNGVFTPSIYFLPTDGFSVEQQVAQFSEHAVNSSVLDYFATEVASGTKLAVDDDYPFDPQRVDEWLTIHIEMFDQPPTRKHVTYKVRFEFEVFVHIYAKHSANLYRQVELTDDVYDILDHAEIPVSDFDANVTGLGWARLQEAQTRDLTPEDERGGETFTEHILVRVRGVAESL